MTCDEALQKHLTGLTQLPWETTPEQATVHFHAGWEAHREALKQGDLFPGTLSGDLRPASLTGENAALVAPKHPFKSDAGLITAEEIYAAWPVKKARGAAIMAIKKAMKKEKPEELMAAVCELASCYHAWPADEKQYLPMCSTFMNQERWADDRSTWRRGKQSTATRSNAF